MNLTQLHSKPASYRFTEDELKFIKSRMPKTHFKAKYALYKPDSYKGVYIGFFIDQEPNAIRRSGIENHWEFICERELSNAEYQETVQNFGTNNRRFIVWHYRFIEALIEEDKKYGIQTPESFVKLCREKGYSGDLQMTMEL